MSHQSATPAEGAGGGLSLDAVRQMIAPSGTLRVGLNMSNGLLVSARTGDGEPAGIAPTLGAMIAHRLGLPFVLLPYPNPGALADAATRDAWDIALLGAEPQRAATIAFTPAYAGIEATYLVKDASDLRSVEEVDRAGRRIVVAARTAYGLWLERNIRHAGLVPVAGVEASRQRFLDGGFDALAGLRPRLVADVAELAAMRLLPGHFMTVQQAVGLPRTKAGALPWLERFVEETRRGTLVAELIARFAVKGLSAL